MLKNVSVYYVYSKYKYVIIKFNNLVSGFFSGNRENIFWDPPVHEKFTLEEK